MIHRPRLGVVALVAALSFMLLTSCSSPTTSPTASVSSAGLGTPSPMATPLPPLSPSANPSTVFAFENDEASPATWTFLDRQGTILHTLTTAPSDGTFIPLSNLYNYVGASSAILARSSGITPATKWSVIHSDGTASPVAPSLTPLLNEVGDSNFPGNFLVAPSTLYAVAAHLQDPRNPFKFYEVNLTTGTVLQSASLVRLNSSGFVHFEPENIDPKAGVISFLISNTTFDNVQIKSLSAVTVALDTNTVSVNPLPPQVARDVQPPNGQGFPEYQSSAFLSGDGSLLIFQSPAPTTYILNLETGRMIPVASGLNPFLIVDGQESVYFSPTDQYAALLGGGTSGTQALFIVDTATGELVADIAAHFPGDHSLLPLGWASPTQLVFITNQEQSADTMIAHLYDLRSARITTFHSGLGSFVAALP